MWGWTLKRMQRWKGQTQVAFVILSSLRTPMPVMARYSSGAAILYDMVAVVETSLSSVSGCV